jgi:hypothetical protein
VENVDGETVIRALEQKGVEAHVKVGTPQELKENCVNFKN